MDRKPPQGLFITGNNTGVGKTHVAGLIAESLRNTGKRVGVYKPAASGMIWRDGEPVWEDVWTLWDKSGRIWDPQAICPQTFRAPLAPHLAARAEGKEIDTRLLRTGLQFWLAQQEAGACDLILVEGAGGLMSPLSDKDYVADLAVEFGFPLVVVAANRLGVINETLQTLITATSYANGLPIAGVVLNDISLEPDDASRASNRSELEARCQVPLLIHTMFNADSISDPVDWVSLADRARY